VEPHLKLRWETTETERENVNLTIWQRCPQQRRKTRPGTSSDGTQRTADAVSGAQSAGRFDGGRKGRKESGASRVAARKARNGKASKRSRNRQAQGKGPPDRSRPPDGTGRRNGRSGDESRFPWEPPIDDGQPDAMSITMQWHSRCDGTRGVQSSITAVKPEANGNSDRPNSSESRNGDRGAGGNTGPIFV
jgi:hypothetical protein